MADPNQHSLESKGRPVGGTENSWCRAVPGGTGITVLGILLSKAPEISNLHNALRKLQMSNPILRAKLHFNASTSTFSYIISPNPNIRIHPFDFQSAAEILLTLRDTDPSCSSLSSLHLILEYEMTRNDWSTTVGQESESGGGGTDVFFVSSYALDDGAFAMVMRLHTSTCDRAAAVALLRELMSSMVKEEEEEKRGNVELDCDGEVGLGLAIEEYIPNGKANRPLWSRGVNMLGYSLNSFRLANLDFVDIDSPRTSRIVRLKLNHDRTSRILEGCKSRGIELCGVLSAAALIAARSIKGLPNGQWEKYQVVTLIDCRSILQPVLSNNHLGFYHSAILNSHDLSGGEELWELAKRTYNSFANAKKNDKHFYDMADVNFLMCKAIENPGLTPSSSLRTSIVSVFEEPVFDNFDNESQQGIALMDYMGCASAHGVGPSIAIFDTVRNGCLDCSCVYPSPLHSREQMEKLVGEMRKILGVEDHET